MTAARELGELAGDITVTTTGLINIDSNTLYVDGVNNSVGIGTNSPDSSVGYTFLTVRNNTNGGVVQARSSLVDLRLQSDADVGAVGTISNHPTIFWTNATERLRITTSGNTLVTGNVLPNTTNTVDLGSAAQRWRNIYTQDLHLSNGIGDWTVVEGEENLYIVNNKSGKSFKFALIEVDPGEVPPKSAG